jgi:hypothetical protein
MRSLIPLPSLYKVSLNGDYQIFSGKPLMPGFQVVDLIKQRLSLFDQGLCLILVHLLTIKLSTLQQGDHL